MVTTKTITVLILLWVLNTNSSITLFIKKNATRGFLFNNFFRINLDNTKRISNTLSYHRIWLRLLYIDDYIFSVSWTLSTLLNNLQYFFTHIQNNKIWSLNIDSSNLIFNCLSFCNILFHLFSQNLVEMNAPPSDCVNTSNKGLLQWLL
jgi:hypothetical protein